MPRSAPVTGAVVQTWHYDSQTNLVTAQIVNVSHKDITAYNISIKETYAGGRPVRSHELMTDTAGEPAFIQELQGTVGEENLRKALRSTGGVGDGLFHPGESRKEIIGVQPGLQNFEAVIDVVAYADSTAEATNNDALQRLISHRKVALTSRQAANDIIKAALADPNDSDPAATAAKQIQNRITVWQAQKHTTLDFEPGVAKGVVDELSVLQRFHPMQSYGRAQVLINALIAEVESSGKADRELVRFGDSPGLDDNGLMMCRLARPSELT